MSAAIAGLQDLPDDVMELVLRHSTTYTAFRVRGVCRALREQMQHTVRSLDLKPSGNAGKLLVSLGGFTKLESLNLMQGKAALSDANLEAVTTYPPDMRRLRFHGHSSVSTGALAMHMLAHMPQLTSLEISSCMMVDGGILGAIATCCPELCTLVIYGCAQFRPAVYQLWEREFCPQLTALTLRGQTYLEPCYVSAFLQRHPSLTELALPHCLADFHVFAPSMPGAATTAALVALDLSSTLLSEAAEHAIWEHCTSLQRLALAVLQRPSARNWTPPPVIGCTRLEKLDLSCRALTDQGLACIVEHCRLLQELNVRDNAPLTDLGLAPLAACLQRLQVLRLSDCTRLTSVGMLSLLQAVTWPQLRVLDCSAIDLQDAVFALVGTKFRETLEEFRFEARSSYTRNAYTMAALHALSGLPRLRRIALSGSIDAHAPTLEKMLDTEFRERGVVVYGSLGGHYF